MILRAILVISSGILLSSPAFAQSERRAPPPDDGGWNVYVGAGALISPTYSGDDDYTISAVPFLRVTKGDVFFASVQEGVGYALINDKGFRAGPLAQLDFGRDEDGSSPFRVSGDKTLDLLGLGKIDMSVSIGGFVDYKFGDFKIKAKAGHALGGHDGVTAQAGIDFDKRVMGVGPPLFFAVGPNIKYGDNDYTQAYYGITAQQSALSGLTEFDAGGGIVSYGVGGSVLMPLSYTAGITLLGSYDRLTGDAADSPLVRDRGSRDQLFGGLAVAKKF